MSNSNTTTSTTITNSNPNIMSDEIRRLSIGGSTGIPQFIEQQPHQSPRLQNENNINNNNNNIQSPIIGLTNIPLTSPTPTSIKNSYGLIPPPIQPISSPIKNSLGQIPPPPNTSNQSFPALSTSTSSTSSLVTSPINNSVNINKSNNGISSPSTTKVHMNNHTTGPPTQLAPILQDIIRENELAEEEEIKKIGSAILTTSTSNFHDVEIGEKSIKDTKSLLKKDHPTTNNTLKQSANNLGKSGNLGRSGNLGKSGNIGRSSLKQSSANVPFSLLKQSTGSAFSRSNASDYLRISSVASYFVNPLKFSVYSEGHMILNASQEIYPVGKDEESGHSKSEIQLEDFHGREESHGFDELGYPDGADDSNLETIELDQADTDIKEITNQSKFKQAIIKHRGLILLIISAFLFSIMAFLVKFVSSDLSSLEIAFLRSFYGLIGCIIILFSLKENLLGPKKFRWLLLARGLSGAISLCAYFFTLTVLPLSEAVIISFTSPVITAALAAVLLKEKWGLVEACCAFLSLCGVTIISKPSFLFHSHKDGSTVENGDEGGKPLYVLIGIAGAFFTAVSYIAVRKVGPTVSPFVLVIYFSAVASATTLPSAFLFQTFVWPSLKVWGYLTLLGVIATAAQAAVNAGIQLSTKTSTAASMNYLQIIFTFIWQIAFLGESIDWITLLGAALILCCAAVTAFKK